MATINLPVTTKESSGQPIQLDWRYAAEVVAAGQPITIYTDNKIYVSSGRSGKYYNMSGIAVNSAQIGQPVWYAKAGSELDVTGLTLGSSYYLAPGTNEVQTLTITGAPTGGTVTLVFGGQTTATIAYNAVAAAVQAALEALSSIGTGNVACAGGPFPGTAVTVTFKNMLGADNVALIALGTNALTGGTTPTLTPTETTPGARGGGLAPQADLVTGDYLVRLGVAKSATKLRFDPYFVAQI